MRLLESITILLRERDLNPNSAQNPHVLKYIAVFPRYFGSTDTRSLQIETDSQMSLVKEEVNVDHYQ